LTKSNAQQVASSFRDPSGHVFISEDRVLRTINQVAKADYEQVRDQGILARAIENGYLIEYKELAKSNSPVELLGAAYVVEHPRIPYISYPYEWSFYQLKAAALHHLNFQLALLEDGAVLSDAAAFNIQFVGSKPVFIDLLSVKPYKEGMFWLGHGQFCEQFLNPLLLRSALGIYHNAWFRGTMNGIATMDLARLMPKTKMLSWNMLSQVFLKAKLERDAIQAPQHMIKKAKSHTKLSKLGYRGLITQMRNWIAKLEPANQGKTIWGDYAKDNTYTSEGALLKRRFIEECASTIRPKTLVDLGCNTGDYSLAAHSAGAEYVIGFDFDQRACELAFMRAHEQNLPFLPLYLDANNPSPDQGWMQTERDGFAKRTKADMLIALAFIHHMAIAKNIPLQQVVKWLVGVAPHGIIEFVPKSDSTVKTMLAVREDIFDNYHVDEFEKQLSAVAKIVRKQEVANSERCLYWYERY
jgi:ribosomal protein L11 methylase PrmA